MAAAAVVLTQGRAPSEASSSLQAPKSTTYLDRLVSKFTHESLAKHESQVFWSKVACLVLFVATPVFIALANIYAPSLLCRSIAQLPLRGLSLVTIPIANLLLAIPFILRIHTASNIAADIRKILAKLPSDEELNSVPTKLKALLADPEKMRHLLAYYDCLIENWAIYIDLRSKATTKINEHNRALQDARPQDAAKIRAKRAVKSTVMQDLGQKALKTEVLVAFIHAVFQRPHFTGELRDLVRSEFRSLQSKDGFNITSKFGDQKTLTVEEKTEVSNTTELTNFFVEAIDAFEESKTVLA